MNRFNLLPSVNWNISHMIVLNETGTMCAYGSRGDIIIIKNVQNDNLNDYETMFIPRAHKNQRVMGLSFVKVDQDGIFIESLASCGDDGRIKIWDVESGVNTHKCLLKKNSNISPKLVDIDVFPQSNCIVSAIENGSVIKWNVQLNKMWNFHIDSKITINCIAVCPHVDDLIAVGAQFGLVLVYSLKGEGKLRHRIRCHDNAVFSLSWCPVPYNALQLNKLREDENFDEEDWKKKDKTLLLASCSKDRCVYICKAGTNGYCEAVLSLPSKPVTSISRYGNINNNDRGRYIKWIYPSILLTSTDFNEMIAVYMFAKNEMRSDNIRQKVKLSNIKYDIKPLHNIHKRMISNFAVHLNQLEEIDFRVWSCSADRLLVRSGFGLNGKEKALTLPLLSGFIFCLDVSPINPDLLAIGTGDGKICIWNLSTDSYIDITTLSKKIDNKVMSLRWHSVYEGVLAFGTYEGRVGIFDLSQGRTTPTLFKLFHNKPIYKLCWAPPVSLDIVDENKKNEYSEELYLFAVGNGEILQFNASSPNEVAISLNSEFCDSIEKATKCKHMSDLCYDSDRKCVAIGMSNGDVCICCAKSFKLFHTITEQSKSIMSMAWHPKIIYENPEQVSPYSNWLATAGENVFVYSVDINGLNPPKKVASLEVHTNRVLNLAWSPHVNGRLLSCSTDCTAIIWDVINQTIIGQYSKHCAQVLCGIWSPINKDVIVTGSADFTCRMWSISKDTNDKIIDSKKKTEKVIEPTVLTEIISTSLVKTSKSQTILPTVSQDFHSSPLLEKVFNKAIAKLSFGNGTSDFPSSGETSGDDTLTQIDDINKVGKIEEENDPTSGDSSRENGSNNKHNVNYAQLFDTEDQLTKLICHEEQVLESSGSLNECLILNQARFNVINKIKEAMSKNQVTEQMLALAPSVSPKLWKEACIVYIEQMIQCDNIFQAVNYQLALGKDDEAIDLLCEKNRFKEAFTISRLRSRDDAAKVVLEKWIHYCYNCGLFRLGAHCFMYLDDPQNASIFLIKSKLFRDIVTAVKLMKYFQPNRAVELAVECFKKHLLQLRSNDVDELFQEFPDIKFMRPWYFTLNYFKSEKPNTASVTKWLLGIFNEEPDYSSFKDDIDYPKLREVIVDNTFTMSYEQLMMYVSAQVALYLSGKFSVKFNHSALRSYIRALFHCYNYKIANSNQVLSDAAYPMMLLLKLMFPNGLFSNLDDNSEMDDSLKLLYKSIKAYYCDFIVAWLMHCDDLPRSIKEMEQNTEVTENSLDMEGLEEKFSIVKNKKTKLETLFNVLSLYIKEILDPDTVKYFEILGAMKHLENGNESMEENKSMRCSIDGSSTNGVLKSLTGLIDDEEVSEGENTDDSKQNENDITSGNELSPRSDQNGKYECESSDWSNVKRFKTNVDLFEKTRVAAPNPFYFYYLVKNFIEKNEEVDAELISMLKTLIKLNAINCGIEKE